MNRTALPVSLAPVARDGRRWADPAMTHSTKNRRYYTPIPRRLRRAAGSRWRTLVAAARRYPKEADRIISYSDTSLH
jgi:hypothetical protein